MTKIPLMSAQERAQLRWFGKKQGPGQSIFATPPALNPSDLARIRQPGGLGPTHGPIVCVDRSSYQAYPNRLLNPELERHGHAVYDLPSVQAWLHPGQSDAGVIGDRIYEYLNENGMLATCLGLHDGVAIQKLHIDPVSKFLGDGTMPLWKSVVEYPDGSRDVPCLLIAFTVMTVVAVHWRSLKLLYDNKYPAARFDKLNVEL